VKRNFLFASLLILLLASTASQKQTAQPKLFKRYEHGAPYNRITENVLTLTIAVKPADRAKIAIRICSKQPFLIAMAAAHADPFRLAELLVGAYAYLPQHVIFVRSEDCLGKDPSIVEIWTLAENGSLPAHVESRLSSQVRISLLGKQPVVRGVRDYRKATQELIAKLKANPTSKGVVTGFFFKRPSATLKRNMRVVKTMFQRSGLPPDRYFIHTTYWNDEYSNLESEPPYPRVFLIEQGEFIDGGSAR